MLQYSASAPVQFPFRFVTDDFTTLQVDVGFDFVSGGLGMKLVKNHDNAPPSYAVIGMNHAYFRSVRRRRAPARPRPC